MERLQAVENKLDDLISLFRRVLGDPQGSNLNIGIQNSEAVYSVDVATELQEFNNYDGILEWLDEMGGKNGFYWGGGPMTKKKDQPPTAPPIACKYCNRNAHKENGTAVRGQKPPPLAKGINCRAYYRPKANKDGAVYLTTYSQSHNHPPNTAQKSDLTDAMGLEITRFNKRSKAHEIKDHLEATFHCNSPYPRIYNEPRRQHPRFGTDDCHKFIEFLELNGALYSQSRTSGNPLCRLLFSTPKMAANFQKFGGVLLTPPL